MVEVDPSKTRVPHRPYGLYLLGLCQVALSAYLLTMWLVHTQKMAILERDYPMWLNAKQMAEASSTTRDDLLVIGDSRAKAGYIPSLADRKSLNLALTGQSPIEGYYLLLDYLKGHPAPTNLLVSYAPYHICLVDVFWEMTVKYGFLAYGEYQDVWEMSRLMADKTLGERNLRWQYFFLPNKYWGSVRHALKERRWRTNEETYRTLLDSNGHFYYGKKSGSLDLNEEAELGRFVPSRLLDLYLNMLIDLAQSRGIQVFWYTMPFNNESCKKLPDSFMRDYDAYLSTLESKKGIKVIEKITCLPNTLFGDKSHLYLGARANTLAILKRVFDEPVAGPLIISTDSGSTVLQ